MTPALCPTCGIRPILPAPVRGRPPLDCGAPWCRVLRRRARQAAINAARAAARRASRATARVVSWPCEACQAVIEWSGYGRKPQYCRREACRQQRAVVREAAQRDARRARMGRQSTIEGEPMSVVDRMLARATAARLAREQAAGRREHTITDGWQRRGETRAAAHQLPVGGWNDGGSV